MKNMKLTVKGHGNKLRYVDELEREKAREFRKCIGHYGEYIRLYSMEYGLDYLYLDCFEINSDKLEEEFFLSAYRKNKDINIEQYAEKLLKKMGIYQLYCFLDKEAKIYERKNRLEHEQYLKQRLLDS